MCWVQTTHGACACCRPSAGPQDDCCGRRMQTVDGRSARAWFPPHAPAQKRARVSRVLPCRPGPVSAVESAMLKRHGPKDF
eukprot:5342758-Prymnesium_polylepis.1